MKSEFLLLSFVVACDATSPGPVNAEPSAPVIRVAEAEEPTPQSVSEPGVVSVEISLVEVRTEGEMVEIEVALPRPLPSMSAVRPSLEVAGETTNRSRPGPNGRLDRLVFLVPVEQYARMSKESDIIVRAGLFTNETAVTKPRLQEAE